MENAQPPNVRDADDLRRASLDYQRSIDFLRARGCRCVLGWSEEFRAARPLARTVDTEACPANHYEVS